MNATLAAGRTVCVGDDVNTDYIVPSHRKKETIDPQILRRYIFEDLSPDLVTRLSGACILIAGENFGCGSAMEVAVTVPKAAGIQAIVAKSFSRTYKRNAINNGLLALTADTSGIAEGEQGAVVEHDGAVVLQMASGRIVPCDPVPGFLLDIIRRGGLVPYLRENRGFPAASPQAGMSAAERR
jgi:3-isopropylmalate/(R)-2-methylmalate dehydratase small subunit